MLDEAELLEAMVAIPSPSGGEAPLVEHLGAILPDHGYEISKDSVGNLIASRGRGRPHVMFLGHVDTVPAMIEIRRREDRLQGRGSVDAKGPLAAALGAGASVPFYGGTLTVVGAVGEESDSRGARHLLQGPAPDYLIVGEPGGWERVTISYRGLVRLRYRVEVPTTHDSFPHPSAGDLAVDFTQSLRHTVDSLRGPTPILSASVKVLHLRAGPGDGQDRAEVFAELRIPATSGMWPCAEIPPPNGVGSVEVLEAIHPVEVARNNAVVRTLNASIRALGGNPRPVRKGGTSDMNLAAHAWHIPMATYGPGDSRLDHSPGEAIKFRDLRQARKVLELTFGHLMRVR